MTLRSRPFRMPGVTRFGTLAILLAATVITACAAPAAEEQDKDWTSAAGLVETSDRIIAARFLEETVETFEDPDTSSNTVPGEVTVHYRHFEVIETYKGTTDREDRLWVAFEPGAAGELVNGSGDVQEFRDGQTYILFLKGRLRPLSYSTDFGPVLWTGNGQPSFAELRGDQLHFWADRIYLNMIVADGDPLPSPLSAAPFTLTVDELETMTR